MTALSLRVVRETAYTITLGWDHVEDAVGFVFTRGDGRRSITRDGDRTTVQFYKGYSPYTVEALVVGAKGSHWEHA